MSRGSVGPCRGKCRCRRRLQPHACGMRAPPASEKSAFSSLILPSAPESVTLAQPTTARGGVASPSKHTGAIHHASLWDCSIQVLQLLFIRNKQTFFYWFKEEMRAARTLFSAMQWRRIAALPGTASSMSILLKLVHLFFHECTPKTLELRRRARSRRGGGNVNEFATCATPAGLRMRLSSEHYRAATRAEGKQAKNEASTVKRRRLTC